MMEDVLKYQREKFFERQQLGTNWQNSGRKLTPYAQAQVLQTGDDATKRTVEIIEGNRPVYRARVSTTTGINTIGYVEVFVNVKTKYTKCPCLYKEDMGINCVHIKALLLQLGRNVAGDDSDWCASRYLVTTYQRAYNFAIPAMTVTGKLKADDNIAPPDFKRTAGRPSKKRKDRSYLANAKPAESLVTSLLSVKSHLLSTGLTKIVPRHWNGAPNKRGWRIT
jgi:hypothetical protein